jgi:hypothetical protein
MGAKQFFIALLILLAACESALQTIPTSQYQPTVETSTVTEKQIDACANVTCQAGHICQAGICGCPTDKKECNSDCIDENSCCTDDDCETGTCQDGTCFEAEECKFGEALKKGQCQCAPDKVYCSEQRKCIDKNDCCVHSQCPSFERCVPTLYRTSLCIKIGEKRICKIVADNKRAEVFNVLDFSFRITATDWWSDEGVTFEINNETIRLATNETTEYQPANATLYQEGIEILGGYCKEDEED